MNTISIIEIDNFLISSEIFTEHFICDIPKCHGTCCIVGDSGAPLLTEECSIIEEEYKNYSSFLTPKGRESIEEQGFWVVDRDGDKVTVLNGGKECSYSTFDDEGNCLCAIEIAYNSGVTPFRKPQSCMLYPIRVSKLSNGMSALNLHRWHLCSDAFVKGQKNGVKVYQFLKEPIIKAFGLAFFKKMEEADHHLHKGE